MKAAWFAMLTVSMCLHPVSMAEAQQIRNGGLTGKVESHRASVSGNLGSAQVHTTPDKGFYVLTQICSLRPMELAGNTTGILARIDNDDENDLNCRSFNPGFVIPQAEVLTCNSRHTNPATSPCIITGVQVKR